MIQKQDLQKSRAPASFHSGSWDRLETPDSAWPARLQLGVTALGCPTSCVASASPLFIKNSLHVSVQLANSKTDRAMGPNAIKF